MIYQMDKAILFRGEMKIDVGHSYISSKPCNSNSLEPRSTRAGQNWENVANVSVPLETDGFK